jgi:hypothetical protein
MAKTAASTTRQGRNQSKNAGHNHLDTGSQARGNLLCDFHLPALARTPCCDPVDCFDRADSDAEPLALEGCWLFMVGSRLRSNFLSEKPFCLLIVPDGAVRAISPTLGICCIARMTPPVAELAPTSALNVKMRTLGDRGTQAVEAMLKGANRPREGILATIIGVGTLVFAAGGVVVQLKDALNTVWEVDAPPGSVIWRFARTYILSLAGVLSLGFLLLISMLLTAALAAAGKYLAPYLPEAALQLVGFAASFAVISVNPQDIRQARRA